MYNLIIFLVQMSTILNDLGQKSSTLWDGCSKSRQDVRYRFGIFLLLMSPLATCSIYLALCQEWMRVLLTDLTLTRPLVLLFQLVVFVCAYAPQLRYDRQRSVSFINIQYTVHSSVCVCVCVYSSDETYSGRYIIYDRIIGYAIF